MTLVQRNNVDELAELSNKTIYSICYFSAYHYWKAFYPYGDGREQTKRVLNTVEEEVKVLKGEIDEDQN